MEELANLLYIVHYQDEGQYDAIILDCAPTGETLRLLSFPEVMHWWMTRMFPIALRSMLDRAIERMEESGETKGRKRNKIKVQ